VSMQTSNILLLGRRVAADVSSRRSPAFPQRPVRRSPTRRRHRRPGLRREDVENTFSSSPGCRLRHSEGGDRIIYRRGDKIARRRTTVHYRDECTRARVQKRSCRSSRERCLGARRTAGASTRTRSSSRSTRRTSSHLATPFAGRQIIAKRIGRKRRGFGARGALEEFDRRKRATRGRDAEDLLNFGRSRVHRRLRHLRQ